MATVSGFKQRVIVDLFIPAKSGAPGDVTAAAEELEAEVGHLKIWAEANHSTLKIGEASFANRRLTDD